MTKLAEESIKAAEQLAIGKTAHVDNCGRISTKKIAFYVEVIGRDDLYRLQVSPLQWLQLVRDHGAEDIGCEVYRFLNGGQFDYVCGT